MALQLRLHEGSHQTHDTEIDLYRIWFGLYRVDSGTYYLPDYRIRGFFNCHYGLSAISSNTGYIVNNIQQTQGVNISVVPGYDDWCSDIRPPRIDSNKFNTEVQFYFPNGTLNGTSPTANQGGFDLMGAIGGGIRLGRYHDVQESYSYLNASTNDITNPMNWIMEHRDNTKTKSILSISSVGTLVTVTTTTSHGYSDGDAIRVTGFGNGSQRLFGNAGERYSGTFKITVTGSNTFTYRTKHVVIAGTYNNTGTCEFWNVHVCEARISSIQGNGTGTISVTTTDNHNLQADDIISISGTTNYNGTQLKVLTSTSTSYTCSMPSNTSNTLETTGLTSFSTRPPSAAIPVNYVSGYEPKQMTDHTTITELIYANKDTYIAVGDTNGHGGSTSLNVIQNGSQISKALFNFPVDNVALADLLFAEICTYYNGGSDGTAQMSLYQMTTDTWNDYDAYNTLNPLIASPLDQVGFYQFTNVGSGENNTYTKFTVSTEKVYNWLTAVQYPSVALVKTAVNSGITNEYLSSEVVEYKPYMVISSGVISDTTKPTLTLTDTFMYLPCNNIQGNGTGKVTITTIDAHLLQAGDVIHLYNTTNYDAISATVLGGTDAPSTYQFKINIAGNTSTAIDIAGIVQRTGTIKISAIGYDDTEISSDSADIQIRKGSSLTDISEYNVIKSSDGRSVTFDFNLLGIDDGFFDVSVKDKVGNKSIVPFQPPIIMNYTNSLNSSYEVVKSGHDITVSGFNVDYYTSGFNAIIGDSALSGGIVSGGTNITVNNFNTVDNTFTIQIPSNLQAEYAIGSIDTIADTITVLNAALKIGDVMSFNSLGNFIQPPLKVGLLYFVKTVTQVGTDSVITLSNNVLLTDTINLTTAAYTVNMVAYNTVTPLYVIRDGFNSYSYFNRLYVRLDEYAPKIYIEPIIGVNDVINVTISDAFPVDQSTVNFINGTINGSIVDVNGDGRVLIYPIKITAAGTFTVQADDIIGNSAYADAYVQSLITPFIEITGHTINSATSAVIHVKVTDGDISPIVAPDNASRGVFVEGSVANSTYGTITNLVSTSTGITFDVNVNGLGDGIMKIYAHDNVDDVDSIIPPVLTSVSPNCIKAGVYSEITGINLSPVGYIRTFLNNKISIYEATASNIYLSAIILSGISDGNLPFILSLTNSSTLLSNSIVKTSDNTSPTINIIGLPVTETIQGEVYTDLGATASDTVSGDVTDSIITTGVVDTTTLGSYTITYTATDDCGNSASSSRTVNVVTGCPIYISVSPNVGYAGDLVTITATVGLFNPTALSNVVMFNDKIAQVISGDREQLLVMIPEGATTGYVQVETGSTNTGYERCSLSNIVNFTVLYDDQTFTTTKSILSIFNRGSSANAIYNRDLSYSGFSEVTDENSMIQNLYTILLTRLGERFFNSRFGSTIEGRLFSPINDYDTFEADVMKEIDTLIKRYEPRIILIKDQSFVVFDSDYNSAQVVLLIRVPSGNIKTVSLTFKSTRNGESNI